QHFADLDRPSRARVHPGELRVLAKAAARLIEALDLLVDDLGRAIESAPIGDANVDSAPDRRPSGAGATRGRRDALPASQGSLTTLRRRPVRMVRSAALRSIRLRAVRAQLRAPAEPGRSAVRERLLRWAPAPALRLRSAPEAGRTAARPRAEPAGGASTAWSRCGRAAPRARRPR